EPHAGQQRGWCAWGTTQGLLDYRNFLQPWAHEVFISNFAKITRHCAFSLPPAHWRRYNVLSANDLGLAGFGIPPVIHRAGVRRFQDAAIFCIFAGVEPKAPPPGGRRMKNRMFVALLLAGVLALPALAQQAAPTTTQDQPAAAASGASGKPALQPDTHEGFWGKINPFARKKYVQRQTAPIRDRVNELDELTSSNTK